MALGHAERPRADSSKRTRRVESMSESTIDRTVLPIRRPPFGGETKKTLEGSVPDWNQAMHVEPPEGAPNVLLVLIDDAGFGNPSTFGGPIDTPNYTRMAEEGLRYNRFHVTAVCSPTRAAHAHGPQPASGRVRPRRRVLRPVPRLQRHHPARLRDAPADPAGERLHDRRDREVAPDAGQPAGLERPLQPLAHRARVRLLLGLPRRRGGPVRPADHREPEGPGRPRGQGRQALLLPGRHGREGDRLAAPRARGAAGRALVHVLRDRLQPCAAPRAAGVVGQVQGQVRPGLGRRPRGDARAPEGARRRPAGHGAARRTTRSRRGTR